MGLNQVIHLFSYLHEPKLNKIINLFYSSYRTIRQENMCALGTPYLLASAFKDIFDNHKQNAIGDDL